MATRGVGPRAGGSGALLCSAGRVGWGRRGLRPRSPRRQAQRGGGALCELRRGGRGAHRACSFCLGVAADPLVLEDLDAAEWTILGALDSLVGEIDAKPLLVLGTFGKTGPRAVSNDPSAPRGRGELWDSAR